MFTRYVECCVICQRVTIDRYIFHMQWKVIIEKTEKNYRSQDRTQPCGTPDFTEQAEEYEAWSKTLRERERERGRERETDRQTDRDGGGGGGGRETRMNALTK